MYRGTGNFSTRFYETLAMGRIPIFINTDCVLPFHEKIKWSRHIIIVDISEIQKIDSIIMDFHKNLDNKSFKYIQISNRRIWSRYYISRSSRI